MKFKVTYYDFESDTSQTKDCHHMNFRAGEFNFTPVDVPIRYYKSISIDHPIVSINLNNVGFMVISVVGYQCTKRGDYEKTTTKLVSVTEHHE